MVRKNIPAKRNAKLPATELFERWRREGVGREIEGEGQREKIELKEVGDFFVARLVSVHDSVQKNARTGLSFKIYYFDGPKNQKWLFLGSWDFDNRFGDGAYVGNVVAVMFAEELNIGKPNAMKLYDALDLGEDWPASHLADDDDDLPF